MIILLKPSLHLYTSKKWRRSFLLTFKIVDKKVGRSCVFFIDYFNTFKVEVFEDKVTHYVAGVSQRRFEGVADCVHYSNEQLGKQQSFTHCGVHADSPK